MDFRSVLLLCAFLSVADETHINADKLHRTARWVSVSEYGAKGDARTQMDASMDPGTTTVNTAGPAFVSGDVGKVINVIDACANNGVRATLEGVIASVHSSRSIVVRVNPDIQCSTLPGLSKGTIEFGTNDFASINAAISATAAQPNGGVVYFPAAHGGYMCLPPSFVGQRPASIVINGDNITLLGDPQQTRIWTRGAYSLQSGKVTRAAGLVIAADRRPHRAITIRNLWLDGGATGYTAPLVDRNPADITTGDYWDVTHAGIVGTPDTSLTSISIDHVTVSNYRGEEILFMGIRNDLIEIVHSHLYATNADTISVSSKRALISDNRLEQAANACIENGLFNQDILHRIERNTCDHTLFNGMIFQGVDNTQVGHHSVIISENHFQNIGTLSTRSLTPSGVRVSIQHGNSEIVANVTIRNNTFIDCQNGITLESVAGAVISGNTFELDRSSANAAINLVGANAGRGTNSLSQVTIERNVGRRTQNAAKSDLRISPLLYVGASDTPRYHYIVAMKNVTVKDNDWRDLGLDVTNYISRDSQIAWTSLTDQAISFRGNVCTGCTRDRNHNQQVLDQGDTVYPLGDVIAVKAAAGHLVTIASDKSQDGQELMIYSSNGASLAFLATHDIQLPIGVVAVVIKPSEEAKFVFQGKAAAWLLVSSEGTKVTADRFSGSRQILDGHYLCFRSPGFVYRSMQSCKE